MQKIPFSFCEATQRQIEHQIAKTANVIGQTQNGSHHESGLISNGNDPKIDQNTKHESKHVFKQNRILSQNNGISDGLLFTLWGNPLPKARARHARTSRGVITYDSQASAKETAQFKLINQCNLLKKSSVQNIAEKASNLPWDSAIRIELTFYLPIAETLPNAKRNALAWNLHFHNVKPDLDNLEKFILDVCNGIIFQDDKQIIEISSKKIYSLKPRTIIHVMPKKPLNIEQKAQNILSVFGPDKLMQFADDIQGLLKVYNIEESSIKEDEESYIESLIQTANALSRIAKNHTKELMKIQKINL